MAWVVATGFAFAQSPVVTTKEPLAALTGVTGDPERGRAIITTRSVGLCLLCHSGPFPEVRLQGNLAPPLNGAGSRWSAEELRQRIADPARFNAETMMPAYSKTDGLTRVAPQFRDKPLFSAQQIEDVVAFLQTLRE